jgi:hypothetical protein
VSHSTVEIQGWAGLDSGEDASVPPTAVRQPTGDQAVDDVLDTLDTVSEQPLDAQIEVIEQVHAVLQDRLADLGKE